jgi:RluA family pseudouridine synthase
MEILFLDESLLVINKPAGLLTIRDGYNPDLPTVKSQIEKDYGFCWIVHRLDKETSGALLIARNKFTHRQLNLAFENRQIKKIYHAIVIGVPKEKQFLIDQPLKVNGDRNHRTIVDRVTGKPARTKINVIKEFSDYSVLSIEPESGYTHQIRAHLAYNGYPILGDRLYHNRNPRGLTQNNLIGRTALHAFQLNFLHPITKCPITIQADYPEDFIDTLDLLK